MKILLPFNTKPAYMAYQAHAFGLGMLKANMQGSDCWIIDKMINCVYHPGCEVFDLISADMWGVQSGITESVKVNIYDILNFEMDTDIINTICNRLDRGYYVYGTYDEYYIPCKPFYHYAHNSHDYFLYGYDDEKQIFYSAGYTALGKYETFELSYENYLPAVQGAAKEEAYIEFLKPGVSKWSGPDRLLMYERLENYLHARKDEPDMWEESTYGLPAWEGLARLMERSPGHYIDMRCVRIFMEHKKIMQLRMKLCLQSDTEETGGLLAHYKQEVEVPAGIVFYMTMKYNATRKPELLLRIAERIREICKAEKPLLEQFAALLSRT